MPVVVSATGVNWVWYAFRAQSVTAMFGSGVVVELGSSSTPEIVTD